MRRAVYHPRKIRASGCGCKVAARVATIYSMDGAGWERERESGMSTLGGRSFRLGGIGMNVIRQGGGMLKGGSSVFNNMPLFCRQMCEWI